MAVRQFTQSSLKEGLPKFNTAVGGYVPFLGAMESIATATLNSSATGQFFNIPQTYQHLHLRIMGQLSVSASPGITAIIFNGDYTVGNYWQGGHVLRGDGASATSGSPLGYTSNSGAFGYAPGTAAGSVRSGFVIDILDYTNTSKNTVWRAFGGYDANGSGNVTVASGLWLSTAAITTLDIGSHTSPYQWVAGSTFALYGIKAP